MSAIASDVIVIGGGLHGLSAALQLARARRKVAVLERAWTGRHASGATAAGVRTLRRDLAEMPLALEAMDMWHRLSAIVGDDCGFKAHGQVCIAETPRHLSPTTRHRNRSNLRRPLHVRVRYRSHNC